MSAARPLRHARGHLLFGEGEQVASLYRLPTVSYAHLTDGDKSGVLWALAGLAYKIGVDFRIMRVARLLDPDTYRAQAEALLDPDRGEPDRWHALLDEHVEMMRGEPVYLPEVFLCATLGGGAPRRRGVLARLDALMRRTEDVAGVGRTMPITGQGLEELRDREHELRDRLAGYLGDVRPATTMELQWLLRRAALRHVAEPTLDAHWRPEALVLPTDDGDISYEPITSVWAELDDAEMTRHGDHLELAVTGRERQVSRQALLRLGALPEQTEFPGRTAELMFDPLDSMDTPVDAFLDVQWVDNRKALSETRNVLKEARQAIKGADEAGQDPGEMRHSRAQLADELRSYLEDEAQPPLLWSTLTYAVGAPNERELRRRVNVLRDRLNTITLYQTAGLQEDLYYDTLAHPVKGRVDDGRRPLIVQQVGAMVPQATRTAGDDTGVYIGYALRGGGRRGEPVLLDLTAAGRENTSPGVLMVGAPGGGKTVSSLGIAYVAGLARGSSLMDGDPKDDHDLVDLPALAGRAQRLVLEGGDPRNRGSLDPLIIAPQGLREDTALSYLLEVLPAGPTTGEWETELAHAIRATIAAGGGSLDLIDALREGNPAAQAAARALEVIAGTGFGSLAFGRGEESPIMQADTSAITITLSGIELPAEGIPRANYTRNDKLAVATTQLVSTAIMRRATRDVSEHVVVFLDEAWVFLASAAGQALLAKLLRLLRAFNATVIIGTQTLHELGNLDELIGTRFVFRQDSPDAARRALRVLGRDPDDEGLAKRLADPKIFRGGHCLMRDRYGRVTEMQTEFPAWLLEQLRTDPAARAARRAAQHSPAESETTTA